MTPAADLAFVNGAVYTVDPASPWAEAVAVSGGRIEVVGDGEEVRDRIGAGTEVIDLRGGLLLPGFQDAHVHPPSSGLEMLGCDLSDATSAREYEGIVADYAATHPDLPWILGGGWSMGAFPGGNPPKVALDRLVTDRPVFLWSRDGHSVWVNGLALEAGGISADTPEPVDGVIVRGERGEPWGTLHEGAIRLVESHIPEATTEDWITGLRVAQAHLHALGITAWQDANVGIDASGYRTLEAYRRFAAEGGLTARVVGALWWNRSRGLEQVDDLAEARERGRVGRFAATSVKIMQDGIVENFTARMLDPYLDDGGAPSSNSGKTFVEPEQLTRAIVRLDREGFQVHVHAIGDRAVREALDAFEAARATNGPKDLRHHIAHIQVVHPADVPRFQALGVVANGQPLWAQNDREMLRLTVPYLGPERAGWQYPFASLLRAGARLAFGSDWSVSSANPLEEMHVAVNRTGHDADRDPPQEPFLPEEAIEPAAAVAAFTIGSAYVNHLDDLTGSITRGKLADLVVLDRNVFEHPPSELASARVRSTFVEGERVFEEEAGA